MFGSRTSRCRKSFRASSPSDVQPTPAREVANAELRALIPPRLSRVVDAGCSIGALARDYRAANPDCEYIGIELDPAYAELARRHCSRVVAADLSG